MEWVKGLYTNTLVFYIVQFFSSLNHQLLSMILNKAGIDSKISQFFSRSLINRQTQYVWNYFMSSFFRANVGVGQRSALSSILSAFYIVTIFHIFEKRAKNLSIPILVLFLSFVDDSLFVSQKKSYEKSNTNLFCSYNIISSLFNQFSLVIKYDKSEIFYFSRSTKNVNPLPLDLSPIEYYNYLLISTAWS